MKARQRQTLAVVPEPESALMKSVRRLPLSGPGIIIKMQLDQLPAYLALHHLEPWTRADVQTYLQRGGRKPAGVVMVRRQNVEEP